MTTNDETTKLNLDATIYPEAPESFSETESGKLTLSSTELQLPGGITFNLGTLKDAVYKKIEDKHIIKLTTTSENEIYISIPGANKLKHISYAESISDSIQNFASTTEKPPIVANQPPAPAQPSPSEKKGAETTEDDEEDDDNNAIPVHGNKSPESDPKKTTDPPIYMKIQWGHIDDFDDTFEDEALYGREGCPEIDIKSYYQHLGKTNKAIKYINTTIEAYDRVGEPIGKSTLKYTGPLKPTEKGYYNYKSFFRGKEYLPISIIRITKVAITYMDNTCVEITDRDTIKAMMSESAKTYKIAPPADPPFFIGIKWGHLDKNEYGNAVVNSGIINDNVDIEIHYVRTTKKHGCFNKLEVTLQAYDGSGNPIGKPNAEVCAYLAASTYKSILFSNFFCGKIYSSIANIKLVGLSCFYTTDTGITIEITDESMLNAITSSDSAIKSINKAIEEERLRQKERKKQEEERKKQEEEEIRELLEKAKKLKELKEEEKKQEIKNARAGCLSLIILVVIIVLLLKACGVF